MTALEKHYSARDLADSFLAPVADMRAGLEKSGFVAEVFEDISNAELRRPQQEQRRAPSLWQLLLTRSRKSRETRGAASRKAEPGSSGASSVRAELPCASAPPPRYR